MALDKLVDSAQLDADLGSVADAIRAKGGTSAPLAFPAGFNAAIAAISGGSPRLQAKTTAANGTVTADSGYDGLSGVTVAIPYYEGW